MNLNTHDAWKQLVKAAFALTVIVAFFWLLWTIRGVLMPLFFACFLAYLLNPLVVRLEKWRLPRYVGALVAVSLSILAVVFMVLIPWPIISAQVHILQTKLPSMLMMVQDFISHNAIITSMLPQNVEHNWRDELQRLITEHVSVGALGQRVWEYTRVGGSAVMMVVSWTLLMPVLTYFVLASWPQQVKRWRGLLPKRWRLKVWHISNEVDEALTEYMRGVVLLMLALAVYYAVALKLIGLDAAISIGVLTGLLVIIPYLGFALGFALAALSAFLQFSATWPFFAVLAVFGLGQLIEGYVLTPRLVGERIGLSPVAVIIALLIFGTLFGFVGMLFALPASAVLVVLARFAMRAYEDSAFYQHDAPVS